MGLEITAKVLKGPDAKVIGISLVAGAETYSEDFIDRFPRALLQGNASISIDGDELVFKGPTFTGQMREFKFKPKPEELEGLRASICAKGKKPTFEPDGLLTPGFKLIAKD